MTNGIVDIKNISKSYDKQVLNELNITIEQGTIHCILGLSGSGKTTFLSILAGLLPFDSGEILFSGTSLRDIPEDRIRIDYVGMIFQKFQLLEHMTAIDNVISAAWFRDQDLDSITQKAITLLDELGMVEHKNKYPHQLSGGQMQRIGIARALINDPDLIIADEPSGSLDKKNSDQIIELLREVSRKGKSVIMTTHDIDVAKMADQVSILRNGKLYTVPKSELDNDKSIRLLYQIDD